MGLGGRGCPRPAGTGGVVTKRAFLFSKEKGNTTGDGGQGVVRVGLGGKEGGDWIKL